MHQRMRLETVFSSKVLLIWRTVIIFILVASFLVPIFYESPESDGLLSGPVNLLMVIIISGFFAVASPPVLLPAAFSDSQIRQILFQYFCSVLLGIIPVSLLGYMGLNIVFYFKPWQWQFRLRFWLLGLACLWVSFFGWSFRSSLLWGFKVIICGVVSAVLWEGVNYAIYRRRFN